MRVLTILLLTYVSLKFALSCPYGEVRLVNVTAVYQGTLEVCIAGRWSSVCIDSDSNQLEAITACRQLGCGYGYVEQLVSCSEQRYKVLCEDYETNLTTCLIQGNSNCSMNEGDECIKVRCLFCQSFLHQGLLPYGDSVGDQRLQPGLDVSSGPIEIQHPFPFFKSSNKSTVYVNSHGVLSLQFPFVNFIQQPLPIPSVPLIIIFWTDTERSGEGEIYYREANDSHTLGLAHSLLLPYNSYISKFVPTHAFIATWSQVQQQGGISSVANTYQVVLITDGNTSYVIFQYEDVQWGSGAQIGFNAGDSIRSFTVPGGLTNKTLNMESMSNVGRPGVFVYQVNGDEISSPQASESNLRPTQLVVEQVSTTSIELNWNSTHNEVDYFHVYCYFSSCPYCSHLPRLNTIQTTQESVTVHGLNHYTEYTCCVTALSSYGESNCSNTVTARTLPAPPSEPQNLTAVEINTRFLTLAWREPMETYGRSIQSYAINCTSALGNEVTLQVYTTSALITGLQPATNYTCCVRGRTTAGYGETGCIQTSTTIAPPSEPQNITTAVTETTSLTISWGEPAEIYGQTIQSYTISCRSTQHNITLDVNTTSVQVTSLKSGTNYTCCIWAVNAAGRGGVGCIQASTNRLAKGPEVDSQSILVAAVSGGALLALCALFVIMITVAVVCCLLRRRIHKHEPMESQQRPITREQKHTYSKQKTSTDAHQKLNSKLNELKTPTEVTVKQQNGTFVKIKNFQLSEKRTLGSDGIELPQLPARRYLEDVELTRQLSEEPPEIPARLYLENGSISSLMDEDTPVAVSHRSYHKDKLFAEGLENLVAGLNSQTPQSEKEEKIYQPLIPARRYEGGADEETSVYQSLTQNIVKGGIQEEPMVAEAKVVNNSEGHYQPLLKQAKPGSMVNNSEGHYQPLLKRAEPSAYERVTFNRERGAHVNNSESVYQPLTKRDEPSHYEALTIRARSE